ncbi:MAG: FAD-dependent oxidoreductase, partial [Rudanella sp.]|nr:FAD-dependent oxidoreductase [Rudanella sp.]
PFIGIHPQHPSVGIFGGFGSKGVSLSPYLAHQFARHLLEGKDLDNEVNIQRCLSL